jgi:hypothetical protein
MVVIETVEKAQWKKKNRVLYSTLLFVDDTEWDFSHWVLLPMELFQSHHHQGKEWKVSHQATRPPCSSRPIPNIRKDNEEVSNSLVFFFFLVKKNLPDSRVCRRFVAAN